MKINSGFSGFDISAKGLSVQRKKMNIIAENIANADTTRTEDGQPYKRKFLKISQEQNSIQNNIVSEGRAIKLNVTNNSHFRSAAPVENNFNQGKNEILADQKTDESKGDVVYMPDHPDADDNGYVEMSNVNIITEMVDMIAATRSFEANLTALNSSKQMAKDSLDI